MRFIIQMRAAILMAAVLCAAAAGCSSGPRGFFAESTIAQVSATPDEVTYEYSRVFGNDFAYSIAAAEAQCKARDKRALVVSLVAKNADRSWATFICR